MNKNKMSTPVSLSSNSFLNNLMPHIKVDEKNFPLEGYVPKMAFDTINTPISSKVR